VTAATAIELAAATVIERKTAIEKLKFRYTIVLNAATLSLLVAP
jgi:hypothetical protein